MPLARIGRAVFCLCSMGAKQQGGFPAWVQTVGLILDNRVAIAVSCSVCKGWRNIDVAPIVEAKGRDYSLINRRFPCRLKKHCRGWNRFHYQHAVMRPLWDQAATDRWDEQDRAGREECTELAKAARGRLGQFRDGLSDEAIVDPASGLSARDLDLILGRRVKPPTPPRPKLVLVEPPLGVDPVAWNNALDDRARKRLIREARG